jgi:hypothetical protein
MKLGVLLANFGRLIELAIQAHYVTTSCIHAVRGNVEDDHFKFIVYICSMVSYIVIIEIFAA